MSAQTYFGYIESIRGNQRLVNQEKARLDKAVRVISGRIKSAITSKSAPGLIWALNLKEIERAMDTAANISKHEISDFPGYARYLRAIVASVSFESFELDENPQLTFLLEQCGLLWEVIANREFINTLGDNEESTFRRAHMATGMTLLGAFQLEISFAEQAEARLRKLFQPFSLSVIEPSVGLSVDDIVVGIRAAKNLVLQRIRSSYDLMEGVYHKWKEYCSAYDSGASPKQLSSFFDDTDDNLAIRSSFLHGHQALAKSLIIAPTDISDALGHKASALLENFSYEPGTVNLDYSTPFDHDAVRARPFAKLPDGHYLLTDFYYATYSPLYRLEELFGEQSIRSKFLKRRDQVLEDDAFSLLTSVIEPRTTARNFYIPVGHDGALAERDMLLMGQEVALAIECKARPLRDVSKHRGNIRKIESDVKRSIQEGYDQACSVIRYVNSSVHELVIWDSDKSDKQNPLSVASPSLEEIIPIVVLDSYYGLISTDLGPWLQVDAQIGYPWVVDRDNLETILRLINSETEFLAYLRWRRNLHGKVINEDEAVFAGFFLHHGAAEMPANTDMIQLDGTYSDVFDADYFRRQGMQVDFEFPTERRAPVWSSMKREGDSVSCYIGDEFQDSVNLATGRTFQEAVATQSPRFDPTHSAFPATHQSRPGRNSPCPCGSGKKYKKCCSRLSK